MVVKHNDNDKLKENIFIQNGISQDNLSKEVILNQSNNDFLSDRNEINRFNNMTQELLDKDKEIQDLKNKNSIMNIEMDKLKQDIKRGNTYKVENDLLKERINEQYKVHKELLDYKVKYKELELLKEKDESMVVSLKSIIRKLMKPEYEEDNILYKHDTLKNLLLKKNSEYKSEEIDKLFIEMEITEDIDITKNLLITIIESLDN
ncbi:MAG: hypothetical protein CMH79_05980 [Nitrospinae bacterium]|nr:hypothetical protein [Nitrospinota bacterium]